jgi:serine/threonine-protein kinase
MAGTPNKFSRFWQELKRRKTDRVLVIYAATAFTILQVSDPIRSGLSLPEWTGTFIIIVLVVGFPVAAIFSWFFDITPGGIEKTKPAGDKKKHTTEEELRRWKSTTLVSLIIIIALLLFNIFKGTVGEEAGAATEKSITVLPFGCLNDEKELLLQGRFYTDCINGTLTSIENITLRTWPPNLNFEENKKSYAEIGKQLKVSFILKGTLSKLTNRIVFIVQLIKAKSSNILWANNYELNEDNFYEVQKDIAFHISSSLNAGMSKRERSRINKKPSSNLSAMRSYLEGSSITQQVIFNIASGNKIFEDLINANLFDKAINSFDEAIKNDPSFALAYAKRATIRSWGYHTEYFDKTSIEKCKADIDKALELDKDLIETKIAEGFYYYYCTFEYQKALASFTSANLQQPNNWQFLYYMALVHRALGNWHKSQKLFAKVLEFNPQDPLVLTNIGMSESMLRNYDKAIFYHNRAIEIAPLWKDPYSNKIEAIILRDGKTDEARKVLDTATLKTNNNMRFYRIQFDIYDIKYKNALHQIELSEPSDFYNDRGEQMSTFGDIYRYLNDNNTAVTFYKSAVAFYKEKLANEPKNCRYLGSLGFAYACLNNKDEAVESGLNAVELSSNNINKLVDRKLDLAKIYVMLGEYDKCLEQLKYLLRNPSNLSAKLLQLDPVWNPIKELPEFKKMISDYSVKKN